MAQLTQFKLDYTFYTNLVAVVIVGAQVYLHRERQRHADQDGHDHGGGLSMKRLVVYVCVAVLLVGLGANVVTSGAA